MNQRENIQIQQASHTDSDSSEISNSSLSQNTPCSRKDQKDKNGKKKPK